PAFFQGPGQIQASHLLRRPSIEVTFGLPIATASLPLDRATTIDLTRRLQADYTKWVRIRKETGIKVD
ncbi:MAG: hypothetical protein ACXWIS_02455, partial [Burkholderiales bacterium]